MAHLKVLHQVLHIIIFLYVVRINIHLCGIIRTDVRTMDSGNGTNSSESNGTVPCRNHESYATQRLEEPTSVDQEDAECTDCAKRKAKLSYEELKQLRFEIVKIQILQKLQMTRPPCPSHPKPPLHPLLEAANMLEENATDKEEEEDISDFSSRTKSIVLYSTPGTLACVGAEEYPCSRFQFLLPIDFGTPNPISAEIWLYKRNFTNVLKMTELVFDETGETLIRKRDLLYSNSEDRTRLIKLRLPISTTWSQSGGRTLLDVQFSCYSGCENGRFLPAVSEIDEERPFLIVYSGLDRGSQRNRRSVNCVEGSTFCCRESLYISFSEIGWDDWILAPAGYEMNFCKGRCFSDLSITRFHHSTMLHRFIHINSTAAEEIGLKMCCTPSKMSSLSILYRDSNDTIIKANLPNMKVETCDCA